MQTGLIDANPFDGMAAEIKLPKSEQNDGLNDINPFTPEEWERIIRAIAANQFCPKSSFAPICPDFVIELRSASDTLLSMQEKMQDYPDNGAQLGLLIDRKNRTVHVYRPGRSPIYTGQRERSHNHSGNELDFLAVTLSFLQAIAS